MIWKPRKPTQPGLSEPRGVQTKEVNDEARQAGAALIRESRLEKATRRTFLFVNNRLEGNALGTIAAMIGSE